jgi:hypothetical protein
MLKRVVGDWGSSLSDGDYACALAALGVLESTGSQQYPPSSNPALLAGALEREFEAGERTPIWRKACLLRTPELWRETIHADAAALAAAWRQYRGTRWHERQFPRLAVAPAYPYPDLFDINELYGWLRHPDVSPGALVLADPDSDRRRVPWHWPLRIGVPDDPEHAGILALLRAEQQQRSWVELLARCFTVGAGRDACDLLILAPGAAERILSQPRTRIAASFVVCLDDAPTDPLSAGDRSFALRKHLRAAGMAIAGPLAGALGSWFVAMLRDVSHDVPIHAAVTRAGHNVGHEALVFGDPRALDRCRILEIAKRQDVIAGALQPPAPSLELEVWREPTFGGPVAGPELKRDLADELRERIFTSEVSDGVPVADEFARRSQEIEQARPPRWIQANAWRGDAPDTAARSFAPRQWNLLAVHIGPTEERRTDAAFPDSQVDFSGGDVQVTVQLELAGAAVASLPSRVLPGEPPEHRDDSGLAGLASSDIVLPPAGNSSAALFAVFPRKPFARVDGRIAIIHNNRVLQTAQVSVPVDPSADRGTGVAVVSEATIHTPDDVEERREYDVAMLVSDLGGKLHLTVQQGGSTQDVQLDDLNSPITEMDKALGRAAEKWDFKKPMFDQNVFTECLYTLAAHGSELEHHLRKKCGDDIDRWERIHLVPSTDAFLPLEYVYDGLPPDIDAAVCPNVLGALEEGSCDRALPASAAGRSCPNQRDSSFLCPMHFWGFRRLIERNGVVQTAEPARSTSLASLGVPARHPYGKVTSMLFGASARAFAYANDAQAQARERAELVQALENLGTLSDAPDWKEWREAAVKTAPNLLVLIVHTDRHLGTPVLEIGDKKLLGRHQIKPDVSGAAGKPQLLILLGCSTAGVTEDFQPYPVRFRDAGVSIVIAPVAPIRGEDAVPIAKQLAELLGRTLAKPEPTAFGELLPVLRRELLRLGHPGVMGVVGFGDGDWLLGG